MTEPEEPTVGEEEQPRPERVRFEGISTRAFEHPADRAALTALRKVPGFDLFVRKFISLFGERRMRLLFLGSHVRVNERQFKDVNRIYEDCLEILDVDTRPELFVAQKPIVNAGAVGADEPFIVLNSGLLELADEDELRNVIGHELGHILSGHVLYKTMLNILLRLSTMGMPLFGLAKSAIVAALLEWSRKSELSSDRAGLLTVQDPWVSYRLFMKMAGGKQVDQMDISEFVRQAEEYADGGDRMDSLLKLLNLLNRTHPFAVLRLTELKRWVECGEYQRIIDGEYARREDDASASVSEDFAETARNYKESAAQTKDPLFATLREYGAQMADAGGSFLSSILERFGRDGNGEAESGADDDTAAQKAELDDAESDPVE